VSRSEEYREIANECLASARMSRSEEQRKRLLELAQSWMTAASLLDQDMKMSPLGGDGAKPQRIEMEAVRSSRGGLGF
jgi:hypothetical protein